MSETPAELIARLIEEQGSAVVPKLVITEDGPKATCDTYCRNIVTSSWTALMRFANGYRIFSNTITVSSTTVSLP